LAAQQKMGLWSHWWRKRDHSGDFDSILDRPFVKESGKEQLARYCQIRKGAIVVPKLSSLKSTYRHVGYAGLPVFLELGPQNRFSLPKTQALAPVISPQYHPGDGIPWRPPAQ
jgi:hypothetical protein